MIKPLQKVIYRLKYRYAPQLKLDRPVDVSLELASACNQRCGYCYHADQKTLPFTKGIMEYRTAQLIIVDAASLGVNSLKFNFRGESTLNPRFKDITQFAKDHAQGSTFIDRITNSNFKFDTAREDIFEGLCNQTKVKVSFDSFSADVMHAQRAGSIHSLALKNIDHFYNHPKRKNTELIVQAVRTKLNKDEDIVGEAKKRWPEAGVSVRDMVGGRVNADLQALEYRERDFSNRQSCLQAHNRLIFDWKGNAQACCPDTGSKIQFGNIYDKTVYQIFNSENAKALRISLLNKSAFASSPCNTCSSFESFKGYKHPWGS